MHNPLYVLIGVLPALAFDTVASATTVVDNAALTNDADGRNWLAYGRTYSEQRYSPLGQVNEDNAAELGLAWHMDLPDDRSLVGTALVVDGIVYFEGSYHVVYAVDAESGALKWRYDPRKALFITGAPKAMNGKIVIGNGGTEWGPSRGYATAYDAETGEQAWRFWVVPGDPADGFENPAMEMAAKTWTGEWWEHGGGGNIWNGITYDPEFNTVYFGTGVLRAWERVKQKLMWEVPLPGVWNPDTLTTAGNLVFQGRADGEFVAYRA
jgi:quinohemoprotein ethanol dehydrogenase